MLLYLKFIYVKLLKNKYIYILCIFIHKIRLGKQQNINKLRLMHIFLMKVK